MGDEKKIYVHPQQSPEVVAVPATIVAGWDLETKRYVALNLWTLVEPLVLAEATHSTDKLDDRDKKSKTVPDGTAADTVLEADPIKVPDGEVWYIREIIIKGDGGSTAGTAKINFRISIWPNNKKYYSDAEEPSISLTTATTTTVDLQAADGLNKELRLPGGSEIKLVITVTAAVTGTSTLTIEPRGRKGRKILPKTLPTWG